MKKLSSGFMVNASVAMALCASASCAGEVPSRIFSISNATVGVTTLDEVRKTYGAAESSRVSGEDGADIEICYVHSSSQGRSFLIFESGVMGGGFKHITGFRITTARPGGKCASTKTDVGDLATGNGIRLGQSLDDFTKAIPVEFKRRNSEFVYEAVSQRAATQEELKRLRAMWPNEKQDYFDVTTLIKAKFQDDRLVDLYVRKIESY